jgi:hypothetical protein
MLLHIENVLFFLIHYTWHWRLYTMCDDSIVNCSVLCQHRTIGCPECYLQAGGATEKMSWLVTNARARVYGFVASWDYGNTWQLPGSASFRFYWCCHVAVMREESAYIRLWEFPRPYYGRSVYIDFGFTTWGITGCRAGPRLSPLSSFIPRELIVHDQASSNTEERREKQGELPERLEGDRFTVWW